MDISFNTQKEGLKKLEDMVKEREKAKGSRLYQVWQKDCKNLQISYCSLVQMKKILLLL